MANEVAISFVGNLSPVTADVYQPDGTEREFAVALTEATQDGLYLGDCATITDGDFMVAYYDGNYIGGAEYDTGVNIPPRLES